MLQRPWGHRSWDPSATISSDPSATICFLVETPCKSVCMKICIYTVHLMDLENISSSWSFQMLWKSLGKSMEVKVWRVWRLMWPPCLKLATYPGLYHHGVAQLDRSQGSQVLPMPPLSTPGCSHTRVGRADSPRGRAFRAGQSARSLAMEKWEPMEPMKPLRRHMASLRTLGCPRLTKGPAFRFIANREPAWTDTFGRWMKA